MALLDNTTQHDYYQGNDFGNYQFISLSDIINQFMLIYVGEDKIVSKAKRLDVAFHAQRALAELSFDTFKSCKSQEITVPATLQMTLPQDYVNYTKVSWVDSAGIKHLIYPTTKTSNPPNPFQNDSGDFELSVTALSTPGSNELLVNVTNTSLSLGSNNHEVLNNSIHVGMPCQFEGDDVEYTIKSFDQTAGSHTVIILVDSSGIEFVAPLINTPTTPTNLYRKLIFRNLDGSLFNDFSNITHFDNFTHTVGDNFFTFNAEATSDFNNIEPGMIISVDDEEGFGVVLSIDNGYLGSTIRPTIYFEDNFTNLSSGTNLHLTFSGGTPDESTTWSNYKSNTRSENNNDDYEDDTYWPMHGERYGLDPQHAQANGSFYIDCNLGKIHFSSNISGKTVVLEYISDSLGTEQEMKVHKFAEEAMYRWILHAIASGRIQTQQIVPRLKKEKFAAVRQAKLRLSNIKLEELTQILRGKSKWIKH
tara:strand:- start:17743 stop:19173 length:1431 start_codon:yes stop_codon:yes gene_type:complete